MHDLARDVKDVGDDKDGIIGTIPCGCVKCITDNKDIPIICSIYLTIIKKHS